VSIESMLEMKYEIICEENKDKSSLISLVSRIFSMFQSRCNVVK